MANDNNPFKSFEERLFEKQAKEKSETGPKKTKKPAEPIEVKKYVKLTLILTSIFAILIILISNIFIVWHYSPSSSSSLVDTGGEVFSNC